MIRHTLKKHTIKIAFGVPAVILLASTLSLVRDTEEVCLIPNDNRYVAVGETVTLHIVAQADEPINVIGATLSIPKEYVVVEKISRENSVIDLWSEEPVLNTETGTLRFSGGIVKPEGFQGSGRVLTLVIKPTKEGTASFLFNEAKMLAHDGTGTEVICGENPITLSIRPATHPNPDVNGDTYVNLYDFGIISTRMFMTYERSYDLNLDGRITLEDISLLFSTMQSGSRLGSLAVLFGK